MIVAGVAVPAMIVVVVVGGVFVFVIVVAMIVSLFHKCIFTCNHPWPEQSCR